MGPVVDLQSAHESANRVGHCAGICNVGVHVHSYPPADIVGIEDDKVHGAVRKAVVRLSSGWHTSRLSVGRR